MPVKNKTSAQKGTINSDPNTIIQNNLEQLIKLTNSSGEGMGKCGELIRKIAELDILPLDQKAKGSKAALSDWENKVYKLIVKRMIDETGSVKKGKLLSLGSATRDADNTYGIGFSAASLVVDLLEKRGLVKGMTNAQIAKNAGMDGIFNYDQKPSGFLEITNLGVVYAAFFIEKRH